jgi:enoyl-CoA hydratase/carnithine racemase
MIFCDWRIVPEGDWKIGLSEVQVGLPLPPVIYLALRRLVSSQHAQQLATRGLLITPVEAARLGLADDVVPLDQVTGRAVHWCETLLALPQKAMAFTRRQARADLAALFQSDRSGELETISAAWWEPDTQSVLRQMAERLKKKS